MESIGNRLYSISLCKTAYRRKIVGGLLKKELKAPKIAGFSYLRLCPFGLSAQVFSSHIKTKSLCCCKAAFPYKRAFHFLCFIITALAVPEPLNSLWYSDPIDKTSAAVIFMVASVAVQTTKSHSYKHRHLSKPCVSDRISFSQSSPLPYQDFP